MLKRSLETMFGQVAASQDRRYDLAMLNPAMSGVVLSEIAARLPARVLEVSCNGCDRRRRLRTDWLVAEHGPAPSLTALRCILAGDCPRMIAQEIHDVCGIHFPELVGLR